MGKWRENVNLGVKIDPSTGPELTTPTDQIHTNHTKVDQYHMTHTWQELAANTANTPNHNSKEQRCPVNVLSDQNLLQKKIRKMFFFQSIKNIIIMGLIYELTMQWVLRSLM